MVQWALLLYVCVSFIYRNSPRPIDACCNKLDHHWFKYNFLQCQDSMWSSAGLWFTHWGRVMHIFVNKLINIVSDNGLSPGRRKAIILSNDGILLIRPPRNKLQWNCNRNTDIVIQENPFEVVVWKMAAILSRPQWVYWGLRNTFQ